MHLPDLELIGAGGEPIDLRRTLLSHGLASLPPSALDESAPAMTVTLPGPLGPRNVLVEAGRPAQQGRPATARLTVADAGAAPTAAESATLVATLRAMFDLDDDLSGFYTRAARDPELAWATAGAGRLLRSASVFEDLVKTICTTNCAWSATERMVGALVGSLGGPAPGAPADGAQGRAFPTAAAMAGAGEAFYRDIARAGYRGPRLLAIATAAASGDLELDILRADHPAALADDEVERRLLALPGVGPYAAAHMMMLLGRQRRLVLDSWTRPKYARLTGRPAGRLVADATMRRRFARYGPYAGLAFWLFVTRDWVEDGGTGEAADAAR